jgi:hypothetical protein
LKTFIELHVPGGRVALVDIAAIKAIFTSDGIDAETIAPPDKAHTMLLNDGTEFEFFGISVEALFAYMMEYRRINGWLRHP